MEPRAGPAFATNESSASKLTPAIPSEGVTGRLVMQVALNELAMGLTPFAAFVIPHCAPPAPRVTAAPALLSVRSPDAFPDRVSVAYR